MFTVLLCFLLALVQGLFREEDIFEPGFDMSLLPIVDTFYRPLASCPQV